MCELLLTALSAAAAHGRLPFDQPTKLTATDQQGELLSFLTGGKLDAGKLLATVDAIPALEQLLSAAQDNKLAATLDAIDPLILPLLDWTLHNPDVYLRQLEKDERFTAIPTDEQYAVCMPARDAQFIQARREQANSRRVAEDSAVTFHFHGSPSHNCQPQPPSHLHHITHAHSHTHSPLDLTQHGTVAVTLLFGAGHSILRTGLKNLSNTQWMASRNTVDTALSPGTLSFPRHKARALTRWSVLLLLRRCSRWSW